MKPDQPIPLGAYRLVSPLGRGAMGEVWRGEHREQGAPVAVKILTGPLARKPHYRNAFREEVRAVAMLSHPHIVSVYDFGQVDEVASVQSGDRYPEGCPYLVMELVAGGSMISTCGESDWAGIQRMLISLLDALGHAHARGLIHRDLKPHNVLLPVDWATAGVRLTDFGLAHALYRDSNPFKEHMAGTPNYMAPEQIRCEWREYGPWTDLYAVGCIAYALLKGTPPFRRIDPGDTLQAHLYVPPPPLNSNRVPPEFERWVHRLLEKDPTRRYQRAADAAWALLQLGDGFDPGTAEALAPTRPEMPIVDPDLASDPTEALSESVHTLNWRWSDWAAKQTVEVARPVEVPPVPGSWRRAESRAWNPLLGVGLGLYGLRTVPLVDRFGERDVLWHALRAASARRTPQAVVLRGPAGMGKSRLADWICERADELGAAVVLRAMHNPIPGPRDGLGPMLARHHMCTGMGRSDLVARMERILREQGETREEAWYQLAALVGPPGGERLSSGERYTVIESHLRRLGQARSVILQIDDAQWGPEAVAVCRRLLDCADLPLLIVLTVEEASRMADAGARHVFDKLGDHTAVQIRPIGALPSDHRPALVQALLGLDCEVAAEVEERTEGSPLFAIHLVGDWVQRRALVPGPRGFTLRPGAGERLPDGIHDIWRQRIDEVLAGRPDDDRTALELAAMLGRDVEADEWRAACEAHAPDVSVDLVELLVARRLAAPIVGEDAWSFAHAMLRESLLRRVNEERRATALHRVCAAVLDGRRGPGIAERRAEHLLGAEAYAAALKPLVQAAWARLGNSDFKGARRVLRAWQTCIDRVDLPADDPRRGDGWMVTCRIARASGDLERARTLAAAAEDEARRHGWAKVLARALVDRAWDAINQGQHDTGYFRMDEAAGIAAELGDRALMANCRRNQGVILLDRGTPEQVSALLRESLSIYRDNGHHVGVGLARTNLAQLYRRYARYDEALSHLAAAEAAFTAARSRWGVAMVLTERGLIYTETGRLDAAEEALLAAEGRYAVIGGVNAPLATLYLARVRLARGQSAAARDSLARLIDRFAEQKRHGRALLTVLALLEVAAVQTDWAMWDAQYEVARSLLDQLELHTRDGGRMAEAAARAASAAGDPTRAIEAWDLAIVQWRALGADGEVERVWAERQRG